MRTYNEIYLDARKALKAAGVEAHTLEARLIVASAAGKTKEELIRDLRLYASDELDGKVQELIKRRLAGEPAAYISGEWEFYGIPMAVNSSVLIPRVDTEVLADAAIEKLKTVASGRRVLDLCCGSGCLGIAAAVNVPCRVVMVDISREALAVCRENVRRQKLTRCVTCVEADALENPPMLIGAFDMVMCNPPYIPEDDIMGLDVSVRDYEPRSALDGGADGLDFYRSICCKWKRVLRPGGWLLFECGIGQAEKVADIMAENGFTDIELRRDTMDIERVVTGRAGGNENG